MPDPTTPTGPPAGPDIVVVLGYATERATAVSRATVAGASLSYVPALPVAGGAECGITGLLATIAACPPDAVVLIQHDDIVLSPNAAHRLADAVRTGATYAVPYTNDLGTDHAIGHLPAAASATDLAPYEEKAGVVGVNETIGTFRPVCLAARGADALELVARRPHDPLSLMADVVGDTVAVGGAVGAHDNSCVGEINRLGRDVAGPVLVANLIVRDEEDNIEACLESVAGLVDRVEVADTGSTDRTVNLLEAAGVEPLHRTWRDDFGWARNEVLDESRDADWILWIDADERADAVDPVLLRGYLHAFAAELDVMEIYVHNVNDADESDAFLAPRLLNAKAISFEGQLHERPVRRSDHSLDLRHAPTGLIELHHYGYQASAVSSKGKAERNLEVARAAYEQVRSAKNALDLARSLTVNHGSDPDEITGLYREGLSGIAPHSHRELAWVRGLLGSHLLATVDDPEAALAEAEAGVALVPEDWGCRAVTAAALNRLGRGPELIAMHDRLEGVKSLRPMTNGRAYRARYLRELAAAFVGAGDVARAWTALGEAAEHGGYQTHEEVAVALAVAAGMAGDVVDHLADLVAIGPSEGDRLAVVGAIAASYPNEQAAAVVRRLAADPNRQLDPDVLVVGLVVEAASGGDGIGLVEHVAVLDDAQHGALAERLTRMGRADLLRPTVETTRPTAVMAAVGGDGDVPVSTAGPSPSGPSPSGAGPLSAWGLGPRADVDARTSPLGPGAELVIVDETCSPGIWNDIRRSIDPAGAVVAVGSGTAPTEPDAWFLERVEPDYSIYRPLWTSADVEQAADRLAPVETADVVAIVDGHRPPGLIAMLRCCVPSSRSLAVVAAGDSSTALRADQVAFVVPGDVVPEPGWVQYLLDAVADEPVGCALAAMGGEVIHAGYLTDGRAVGAGIPARANPFLLADARRQLGAPYAIRGGPPESGSPTGRLLGGVVATVDRDIVHREAAGWRESVGESVVVVCEDDDRRQMAVDSISAEGLTPLVWLRNGVASATLDRLGSSGALVLACESVEEAPLRCSLTQLVGASKSRAVVTDDEVMLEDDYDAVARSSVTTGLIWVGSVPPQLDQRIDVTTTADRLAGHLGAPDWPEHRSRIPSIEPVAPRAGVVSIVIPVFGKVELTLACLDAVRATAGVPYEIVVVDDASPDDTATRLESVGDVTLVRNPTNLGFPGSVNRGLAAARGEFVCVLNNDTEPAAGWLTEMLAVLAEPGVEMVGPRSNRIAGRQLVLDAPGLDGTAAAHAWASDFRRRHSGTAFDTLDMKGMCVVARRSLFERLGGLDEGFGRGNGEDDEFCDRVIAAGGRLRVANGAVVLHHGSATFREIDIDYGSLLRRANRATVGRPDVRAARDRIGLTAVVLSDGDVVGAMASVESGWPYADRIVVIERSAPALTDLAMGAHPADVSVRRIDWRQGGAAALSDLPGEAVLVLIAGDVPLSVDPGVARAELDRHRACGAHVETDRGPSARLLPLDATGTPQDPGSAQVVGMRLTR